jgi:hypothetical protein
VTNVLSDGQYVVHFDGIIVPEGTEPGRPGPEDIPHIYTERSRLLPRTAQEDDALKKISWGFKVAVWVAARAARSAATAAAHHAEMCARFGHLATQQDPLPISWTRTVDHGMGQKFTITQTGFLLSTDLATFICSVKLADGKHSIPVQELNFR